MPLRRECVVCESTNFENVDGCYYCVVCGTKFEVDNTNMIWVYHCMLSLRVGFKRNNKKKGAIDIEAGEDEDQAGQDFTDVRQTKKVKKSANEDQHKEIEKGFSTFEVYTYVLKRQCDDLIRLGVNPVIKHVVFRLWQRYLKKLGVGFLDSKEINKNSFKWKRDKEYLLMCELSEKFDQDVEKSKREEQHQQPHQTVSEPNISKMNIDENESSDSDDSDSVDLSHREVEENEEKPCDDSDEDDEELAANVDEVGLNRKFFNVCKDTTTTTMNIVLSILLFGSVLNEKDFTKFEWIRMAHTIAIVNLALLISKSHIFISDLVRFAYTGRFSYFNIDDILPKSMKFIYKEDSRMFNKVCLPSTDFLRCLTFKLANYLDMESVEIVDLNVITTRFIVDLNLPDQLDSIVNMLMRKVKPLDRINFGTDRLKNLEAIALSYVFVAILVVFIYDSEEEISSGHGNIFKLNEWQKQTIELIHKSKDFQSISRRPFKREDSELSLLKLIKHRFVKPKNIKTYEYKCRLPEFRKSLKAPLNEFFPDKPQADRVDNEPSINSLFYFRHSSSASFSSALINSYVSEEKLNLLESTAYRSDRFNVFVKNMVDESTYRGEYLLGYRVSTIDWLLDLFHEMAQTSTFNKMFIYCRNLVNKLVK